MTDFSHWEDGGLFDQLSKELARQDKEWGEQNHPDGTGPDEYLPTTGWEALDYVTLQSNVRQALDDRADRGDATWVLILLEEVFEALSETDPEELSKELNEVAAVAVQWRKAIERRSRRRLRTIEFEDGSRTLGVM